MTAVPPTEADRNREKVLHLEQEVDRLAGRNAELEAALAAALRQAPTRVDGTAVPAEVLAAAPFAVSLHIGRFSGLVDDGRGGWMLRLYLEPLDGRGDVVQVAGSAEVEAILIDEAGVATVIGRVDLDPVAWREHFRSGFMGRHYTIEVPLSSTAQPPRAGGSALARARVNDGLTGRTLVAESLFPMPLVRSAP